MQKSMLFAGFTAAKKTIIQNWFTPHMCGKTYWIRSLLQIVTCECTTAWVGGARPSTIDACSVFCLIYVIVWRSDFCVFGVLPSLPPFWLDFEMLSMCLLFVLLYFGCCVVLCVKKIKNKIKLVQTSDQKYDTPIRNIAFSSEKSNLSRERNMHKHRLQAKTALKSCKQICRCILMRDNNRG